MQEKVLLHLNKTAKTYDMGQVKVEALKPTTLDIYEKQFLVILGPSGSGKSTLLNLIGGIDRPTTGDIIFEGKSIYAGTERELMLYRRRVIGFVFQFFNLIPDLTAFENVALAAELVPEPMPVDQVLEAVGLTERRNHFPAQLSGGEQQRVAIARALVKRPRLLLCDEPTGALDYQTGKLVLGLLHDINRQGHSTVVVVTHNSAIAQMGDRVLRMRSGEIVEDLRNPEPVAPERIEW